MITSTTPYKLVEIIRDTWPNLYRPAKVHYNDLIYRDEIDKNILNENILNENIVN